MQRITVPAGQPGFNSDDLQVTQDSLTAFNPDRCPCQRCGRQIWAFRKTATYRRGITYVKDGRRLDEDIMIPVYLCRKCGKSNRPGGTASGDYSHAILPDTLIPFTYYTLCFILTVLDEYTRRTRTVTDLCAYWAISVSTLYRWKKRYMDHYEAWADSAMRIRKFQSDSMQSGKRTPEEAEAEAVRRSLRRIHDALTHLPADFFMRFRFSFLQSNHLTHFRPPNGNRRL